MIENKYYIYAKRPSEKNWSSWAQAKTSEMAFLHCEKIREAGFLAKVCDRKSGKVVVKDE